MECYLGAAGPGSGFAHCPQLTRQRSSMAALAQLGGPVSRASRVRGSLVPLKNEFLVIALLARFAVHQVHHHHDAEHSGPANV